MKKKMNARYAGKCTACGKRFLAGTPIDYDSAAKTAAHAVCPAADAPEPAAPTPVPVEPFLEKLEALGAEYANLSAFAKELGEIAHARAKADFVAAGGCLSCSGTGTVLTWSTMDGEGYNEFGACTAPGCSPETRKASGTNPAGSFAKFHPTASKVPSPYLVYPFFGVAKAWVDDELHRVTAEMKVVESAIELKLGAVVEVVKGRKVPIGTKGTVIWIGEGRSYAPRRYSWRNAYAAGPKRVGIKDAEGTVHWTAASNVEVTAILPEAA